MRSGRARNPGTDTTPVRRGKQPITPLAGPYGHPVHPLLVAVPIGAWVTSFGFDAASKLANDGAAFAQAAFWLLSAGLAAGLLAATVGLFDFATIPARTRAHRTALTHALLAGTLLVVHTVNVALRVGSIEAPATTVPLALSAAGLLLLVLTGWFGGELAYRHGVRVADEQTQRDGFVPLTKDGSQRHEGGSA